MKNSKESQKENTVSGLGAIGVGLEILVIGLFFDPIGSSPDTGAINLGVTGTKLLLDAFGIFFLLVGIWGIIKSRNG
jgi:hypothetical protein